MISGSIPPKCPTDIYSRIIKTVNQSSSDCRIILDVSGEPLRSVFDHPTDSNKFFSPYLIKPNKEEFETLVNKKLNSIDDIKIEAHKVIKNFGVNVICVSLGGDGAFITNGTESFFAPPVKNIVVKGTVCAGDSMVAGLVTAFVEKLPLKDAFKRAVASATSCVMQGSSSVVSKETLNEIIDRVEVNKI